MSAWQAILLIPNRSRYVYTLSVYKNVVRADLRLTRRSKNDIENIETAKNELSRKHI